MCGEHERDTSFMNEMVGSSPHVRGAPRFHEVLCGEFGIIPACAGSTRPRWSSLDASWDHPRMCGEHRPQRKAISAMPGSSPHVRGARTLLHRVGSREGIIPACAGSTFFPVGSGPHCRDHPRMCGEHLGPPLAISVPEGSSPHVRGALGSGDLSVQPYGIIPACAGSTITLNLSTSTGRDHPRMCGEHLESLNPTSPTQGSSPHVRGAHGHVSCHVGAIGIIPACAGSTHMDNDLNNMGRDHPRMCGEHGVDSFTAITAMGSSPHVRGAPNQLEQSADYAGIIPACAGSTISWTAPLRYRWDHPRMCGEHH